MDLSSVLPPSLDSDTREYLTAALDSCSSATEAMELLEPFLEDCGVESAEMDRIASQLGALLGIDGKKSNDESAAQSSTSTTTQLLAAPIVMAAAGAPSSSSSTNHETTPLTSSITSSTKNSRAEPATAASAASAAAVAPPEQAELLISTEDSRFSLDAVGDSEEVWLRGLDLGFEGMPPLLEGAVLRLAPGHRYCLLGPNGSGKSTLLRSIATGKVPRFPSHINVLYVDQNATVPNVTPVEYVTQGDTQLQELLRERDALVASHGDTVRLSEVEEELNLIDAATAQHRAQVALRKLGFSEAQMATPLQQLSGGWRVKCSIARALFCPPRFLLLDEITNHLDLYEIVKLQRLIVSMDEICVVCISHDRAFVDAVSTDMMVLKDKKLTYFKGNFSAYLKDKEERLAKQQRLYDAQEKKRAHITATIEKGVATARRTGNDKVLGMVASRKKKLEDRFGAEKREDGKKWKSNTRRGTDTLKKYENAIDGTRREIEAPEEERLPVFKFLEPPPLLIHGACIQLEDVSFTYPGSASSVLEHISLSIDVGLRIGILGRNGAGKSTLIGLLMGQLTPTSGTATVRRQACVRLFNQHHAEALRLDETPLQHMMALFPDERDQILRNHLGSFGVGGATATLPIQHLSGGQKSRVALAAITYARPHILVLDEVTNNLDYESIQALQEALAEFAGGIVLVSHDRCFMKAVANDLWLLENKRLARFEGTVDDYAETLVEG